jgi:undecaprenyl pyrophosphate phosphatase UppP
VHLLNAALLGVVQGLTEFLPISSTAHLILGARMLGFDDPGGVFTVMIQLGAILAVIWLYRAKVLAVVLGLPTRPEARRFAALILIGFVPALVAGALFSDYVKQVLYYSPGIIATAFIAGGIVMLLVERLRPRAGDGRRLHPVLEGVRRRLCASAGARAGGVSLRRYHRGRSLERIGSDNGRRVLLLPVDAYHGRGFRS